MKKDTTRNLISRSFYFSVRLRAEVFFLQIERIVNEVKVDYQYYCGNSFERNWCCVGGELKHNELG